MSEDLDPRLHPLRDDLAGAELKGRVERPGYVEGRPAQVAVGTLDLRRRPGRDAPLETQLLHGAMVRVYDLADGWAWLQHAPDGYMGYAAADGLRDEAEAPSHWVRVLRSFGLPVLESPVRAWLLDDTERVEIARERRLVDFDPVLL